MFKLNRETDEKKRPMITIGESMECVTFSAFMNILEFSAGKARVQYQGVNLNRMLRES